MRRSGPLLAWLRPWVIVCSRRLMWIDDDGHATLWSAVAKTPAQPYGTDPGCPPAAGPNHTSTRPPAVTKLGMQARTTGMLTGSMQHLSCQTCDRGWWRRKVVHQRRCRGRWLRARRPRR